MSRVLTGLISSVLLLSIVLNIYLGAYFAASLKSVSEVAYEDGDVALAGQRIVVLPVRGMINDDTAAFVRSSLRALDKNPPKALILRVDSPGGAVSPSDRIWHMLREFKQKHNIPMVASFGSMAASGGYYISAACDHLIAEPTTITGSIGVIAQAFTVEELMKKIGVTPEIIAATGATKKDTLNSFRNWTDKDRNELRFILDEVHELFIDVVSQGRKGRLTPEEVRVLATGEPFTLKQALANKLVDEQGYLEAAIAKASALANLSGNPPVFVIQPPKSVLSTLMGSNSTIPQPDSISGGQVRQWLVELSTPQLEYRWAP
jgi:protease-4